MRLLSRTSPNLARTTHAQPPLRPAIATLLAAGLPAQSFCFDIAVGTDLRLTDDSTAQGPALGFPFTFAGVAYNDVCVCSNGFIWFGPTSVAGGDYTPTEAELLAGAPRFCPHWLDFNPGATGSGHVYFNAVPAAGGNPAHALITWAGVYEFGRSTPIDMQVRLDATNSITVTYGATAPTGGTTNTQTLIGGSPGGGAAANPVTFATRPFTITQNTFAEVLPAGSFALAGVQMSMFPTATGYVVADLTCTPISFPGPALFSEFGTGCPQPPTIYEAFDTSANLIDLGNRNYAFLPNGAGGYVLVQGIADAFFTGFSNRLQAGDDTTHLVPLPYPFPFLGQVVNSIIVSSNGFIWVSTTNGGSGCCSGNVGALLSGQPRIAAHWTDLYTSPGGVFADLDPATGDFCITWNNVSEFGQPSASNTFQIALKPSGIFEFRYQNVMLVSHASLTGFSGGLGAPDRGGIDLSAVTQFDTGPGGTPLDLDQVGTSLPQLGANMNLQVTGLSAGGGVAFLVLCFFEAVPPIDMAFLGAPG